MDWTMFIGGMCLCMAGGVTIHSNWLTGILLAVAGTMMLVGA